MSGVWEKKVASIAFFLTFLFTKNACFSLEGINNSSTTTAAATQNLPSAAELRLPTNVVPLSYDLTVKVYLPSYINFSHEKDFTFDGNVEIALKTLEPINRISLNMKNINISKESSQLNVDGENVAIEKIEPRENFDMVDIVLTKSIENSKEAKLKLVYTGEISDTLGGLYRTTYTEIDGTKKFAAITHMEPINARRFVPCFDEPLFKAPWRVTVIHPKGTNAVSNGIELTDKKEKNGGWMETKFTESPKMSSYLLAVMVSEFEYIKGETKSGTLFRIWSRREAKEMTNYALQAGIICLEYYEKLFNTSFPLRKQDMVALPDFAEGAMENWGLITYRESVLLYDEKLYGPKSKMNVAITVAHELAHQWFGNLVTMKWWDDLWLNEGFATYVEYLGADVVSDGRMRMQEYFIIGSLETALSRDSASATHPLSFKIDRAEEVIEAFDDISYEKGASVIRMIARIIGQDNFNNGIAHYISKFAYDNAQASDLWQAIDEVIGYFDGPHGKTKITDFADQWTTQMGFPLVTVEMFNTSHVKLTQERYKRNPNFKEKEKYQNPKYGFKWEIPIWYQEGKEEAKLDWMNRDEPHYLKFNNLEEPLVINTDRYGFYRQNYDEKGWRKIANQLKENHEIYSSQTRNGIISDAFAAALVDKVPYETVFDLISYITAEREFLPWHSAIESFNDVFDFFVNEPEAKYATDYMLKLLEPIYKTSSLEHIAANYKNDDLYFEINLEQAVIDAFCKFGSEECRTNYKKLFDKEVFEKCKNKGDKPSECSSVAAPLRANTYCYGVKEGGNMAYQKVMELYLVENVQLEKNILRQALGCHKNVTALEELMFLALDRNSSFLRLQDASNVFASVSQNPAARELIFNFLIERWGEIYTGLMPEHEAVGRVILAATEGIRSQHQIEQIKYLKKNGEHADKFGYFDMAIETSEYKVEWITKHYHRLSKFFKKSLENRH